MPQKQGPGQNITPPGDRYRQQITLAANQLMKRRCSNPRRTRKPALASHRIIMADRLFYGFSATRKLHLQPGLLSLGQGVPPFSIQSGPHLNR